MMMVHRKEYFNAAHKLWNIQWSKEKNAEVFGPCANENWHGHNFELIVTVKGEPDTETGFVVDMKKLGDLIRSEVVDKVDHKNLNLDVPFMRGKLTSCENLIKEFWNILEPQIKNLNTKASLYRLRLHETSRNFVDYYGEREIMS